MLTVAKDTFEITKLKVQLHEEFEMKNLRTTKKTFRMEILRGSKVEKLLFTQKKQVEKNLKYFNVKNAEFVRTPIVAHFKISTSPSPQIDEEKATWIEFHALVQQAALCMLWYGFNMIFHM